MQDVLRLPWLEIAIATSLFGAMRVVLVRGSVAAYRWSLAFSGATLFAAMMEWLAFTLGAGGAQQDRCGLEHLFRMNLLTVDVLNAPLLPLVALLHFLTALATARTKMSRFAFDGMLLSGAVRLATFGSHEPWLIIALVVIGCIPTYAELVARQKPTRIFLLHVLLVASFLVAGWWCVEAGSEVVGCVLLMVGILVRCGTIPVHVWVTDLFENASLGNALLYIAPITGVYVAVRLVLPIAPAWVLSGIGLISLLTAVYTAGMALVQKDCRRFFAFLLLSHASLVLVGLEQLTPISLTGALAMWFSVALSLTGLGLTLRALEARYGRLSLDRHQGLYEHSPTLAICFLLTSLAAVGFPGTLGFISVELLVDGLIEANLLMGLGVVLASALNGVAVVRVYFLLFTGTRGRSEYGGLVLGVTLRERVTVLTLLGIILGGGLFPQPGIRTRHDAAEAILRLRGEVGHVATPDQVLE